MKTPWARSLPPLLVLVVGLGIAAPVGPAYSDAPAGAAAVRAPAMADAAIVTLASDGTAAAGGWFRRPVTVSVAVPAGREAQYRVDRGAWTTYTSPFVVSRSGTHQVDTQTVVSGRAVTGSRTRTAVLIDSSPPYVTVLRSPSTGVGSPRNPVTVTLTGSDRPSGIERLEYRVADGAWETYSGPVVVGRTGTTTVSSRAVDRAGNLSTVRTATIRIAADPVTGSDGSPVASTSVTVTASPPTVAGAVSYRLVTSAEPTADELDAYARITAAMDAATARYNRLSRAEKQITVYYSPGVPTAEANINGDLRFGSDRGYMTERTALHEIAHTLGVGQSGGWYRMSADGGWTGEGASALVRQFDGPDARLNSGGGHFWPYGLNYEDEWSDNAGDRHVLMVQAMLDDGM